MKAYQGYLIAVAVTLLVTLGGVGIYASSENKKEFGVFTPFPGTETKTETKKEPLSFTIDRTEDESLPSGQEITKQQGENGEQTYTYKVTYKGKKKVKEELINSEITKAPKNSIVSVGTYTAPVAAPAPVARSNGGSSSSRPIIINNPVSTYRPPTFCTYTSYSSFCT